MEEKTLSAFFQSYSRNRLVANFGQCCGNWEIVRPRFPERFGRFESVVFSDFRFNFSKNRNGL